MLKREWGAESNGKLAYLSIPSKTPAWVPTFAVEDLPLGRTSALVPGFAVKDLPLGRTHWCCNCEIVSFVSMYVSIYHGCANYATEGKCFCPPSAAVT